MRSKDSFKQVFWVSFRCGSKESMSIRIMCLELRPIEEIRTFCLHLYKQVGSLRHSFGRLVGARLTENICTTFIAIFIRTVSSLVRMRSRWGVLNTQKLGFLLFYLNSWLWEDCELCIVWFCNSLHLCCITSIF